MSPWALLGIEPTQDQAVIRRAYARRVKALRIEEEPQAFQRLRDARELALKQCAVPAIAELASPIIFFDPPVDDLPKAKLEEVERTPIETKVVVIEEPTDVGEGTLNQGSRPKVTEVASIENEGRAPLLDDRRDDERKLDALKSRLVSCLMPLQQAKASVDMAGLETILTQIADLPRGARREGERFCLIQIAGRMKNASGVFDSGRALRVRPLVVVCDLVFGWQADDELLHTTLAAQDAETLMLMLDPRNGRLPTKQLPFAARLRRSDAQALFEDTPHLLSIYKKVVGGQAMPWRWEIWAVPVPYLWALRRRFWIATAAWYLICLGSAIIAFATTNRTAPAPILASTAWISCCCLASGFLADRTAFFYAWRWSLKADKRGLFDPGARKAFLKKRASKLHGVALAYAVFVTSWFSLFPYFGLARLSDLRW